MWLDVLSALARSRTLACVNVLLVKVKMLVLLRVLFVTYNNYSLMVPIPALAGQELNATVNMTVELQ